ncbi:MAG: YciI family protein [Rhizobiaceae bacterium]|nr:YciI family protein [Rhizobiaceae bacterium]
MLYAILCYNDESTVFSWSKEEEQVTMDRLIAVQTPLAEQGKLGPVARLMPTTAATTLRKGKGEPLVIDGPFAETKEQLLGFYVVDFETLDEAVEFSKQLAAANPGAGAYEIRPLYVFRPGTAAT